jgi:hypothetical protein
MGQLCDSSRETFRKRRRHRDKEIEKMERANCDAQSERRTMRKRRRNERERCKHFRIEDRATEHKLKGKSLYCTSSPH